MAQSAMLAAASSLQARTPATPPDLRWGREAEVGKISAGQAVYNSIDFHGSPEPGKQLVPSTEVCAVADSCMVFSDCSQHLACGKATSQPGNCCALSLMGADANSQLTSENTKSHSKRPAIISLDQGEHISKGLAG